MFASTLFSRNLALGHDYNFFRLIDILAPSKSSDSMGFAIDELKRVNATRSADWKDGVPVDALPKLGQQLLLEFCERVIA